MDGVLGAMLRTIAALGQTLGLGRQNRSGPEGMVEGGLADKAALILVLMIVAAALAAAYWFFTRAAVRLDNLGNP